MVNWLGECMPMHVQAPDTNTIIPVRSLDINPLAGDTEDEDEDGICNRDNVLRDVL